MTYGAFIREHTPTYTARKVACSCGWSQRCIRDTTGHGLDWAKKFYYRRHIDALWRDLKGAR